MRFLRPILAPGLFVLLVATGCGDGSTSPPTLLQPPSAEINAPSDAIVGQSVQIFVLGEAPGHIITSTRIDFDGDDVFDESKSLESAPSSVAHSYEHTYSTTGEFTIQAELYEGEEFVVGAIENITIVDVPVLMLDLSVDSNMPVLGESVRFTVVGTAPDNTITETRIDFENDGHFDHSVHFSGNPTSITWHFDHIYPSIGTFTALAQICDGPEILVSQTIEVTTFPPSSVHR